MQSRVASESLKGAELPTYELPPPIPPGSTAIGPAVIEGPFFQPLRLPRRLALSAPPRAGDLLLTNERST